jgi:predicted nucleic acid-binding protein
MILLDTNVVIAFLNGNKAVADRISDNVDKIALSALVVAELNYGAKASQNALRNVETWSLS